MQLLNCTVDDTSGSDGAGTLPLLTGGDPVFLDGRPVGMVTSACHSASYDTGMDLAKHASCPVSPSPTPASYPAAVWGPPLALSPSPPLPPTGIVFVHIDAHAEIGAESILEVSAGGERKRYSGAIIQDTTHPSA